MIALAQHNRFKCPFHNVTLETVKRVGREDYDKVEVTMGRKSFIQHLIRAACMAIYEGMTYAL